MSSIPQALNDFDRKMRSKGYVPLEPFFVLREAEIADERTGGKVKLTKARLDKIAGIQNQRIADTGDATPIIIGHTRRHLLEKEQPPIAGYATRYETAKFLNTNTWGLKATPWCKPEDKVLFERFPRRSCELWTDPDLIDPISLLGANTPRLDLGLHQLSRDQALALSLGYSPRTPLTLEMSMADDTDNGGDKGGGSGDSGKPATPGNVSAAQGTQTSDFAQLKSQVDQLMQMMGLLQPLISELQMDGGGGMGGPPGAGAMPPGGGMGGPPGAGAGGPLPGPIQAMGTPPGGGNAMLPQQFGRQDVPMQFQHVGYGQNGEPLFQQVPVQAYPQQPLQFQQPHQSIPTMQQAYNAAQAQQPQQAQSTAQLQARVEALQLQLAQTQLARLGDEVNMVLNDLETKIVIDRKYDYDHLIKLEKPQRDAAIQFMLQTRKQVEPAVPSEALPLQFHAQPPQVQMPQQNAPIQLGTGHDMYMPPDPNLGRPAAGPRSVSTHDALMEIVRNRGKLSSTQALDNALAAARNGGQTNGIPVR